MAVKWTLLPARIDEVSGLNLDHYTTYNEEEFRDFPEVFRPNGL
jgi:hypothetical protein